MVDMTVTKENHDFSEREQKIFEVLLLNLAAHANAQTTKQNMAFNPLERKEKQLFHFQFAWQKSISEAKYKEFAEAIESRYDTAFKMCELEGIQTDMMVNSYLKA